MDTLGKLFGSPAKVKIMRMFLVNPQRGFEAKDVTSLSGLQSSAVRKDLLGWDQLALLKEKFLQRNRNQGKRQKKAKDY